MWGSLVVLVMGRGTWKWIAPDGLREITRPLIPEDRVRPQGGGTQDTPDETLFAAIIYVLASGCSWRALPPGFGISKSTAHRRFLIWSRTGVWGRLHEEIAGSVTTLRTVSSDTATARAGADEAPSAWSCASPGTSGVGSTRSGRAGQGRLKKLAVTTVLPVLGQYVPLVRRSARERGDRPARQPQRTRRGAWRPEVGRQR
jgi:transposase